MIKNEQDLNYGFIAKINDRYNSFCTCSPYIQNYGKEETTQIKYQAAVYMNENNQWFLKKVIPVKDKLVEVTSNDLSMKTSDIAVIVPVSEGTILEKKTKVLPDPIILKKDNSWVPPRFNIGFCEGSRTVSYLGEYPKRMSSWNKNLNYIVSNDLYNLISFHKKETKKFIFYLILIPILSDIESLRWQPKYFLEGNKKIEKRIIPNKCNIITLSDDNTSQKKLFSLIGKGFNSIPIFLIVDSNGELLSIEHTHPPDELFWGKDKFNFVKSLKQRILVN